METVILALQREPGEGWGMNIGRRGEGGAFVVTSIKPGGAASRGPAAATSSRASRPPRAASWP